MCLWREGDGEKRRIASVSPHIKQFSKPRSVKLLSSRSRFDSAGRAAYCTAPEGHLGVNQCILGEGKIFFSFFYLVELGIFL